MEYGGADSISVEKWSLAKKSMGFQVIPLSECRCCLESIANAECYGSSERSYGIEHGLRSDLQLFLSGTDEGPSSSECLREYSQPNVIMFHHVVPNAKAMVSVTWIIPIRCTRWLISKTFRLVTITCLLPNPEIRQRRSCQNVRVWEQLHILW